ncbi:MAG: ABC transporter substrate-binding protein [Anaerolineae bacterium]
MNTKRVLWYMLVAMVMLIVLAACAPVAAPTTAPPAATEVPVAEAGGQYPPIVVSIWSGPEHDNMVKVAKAYEEETGNQVIVEEIAREALREKTTTVLVSGSGDYDVSYVSGDWIPEFVIADTLADFDQFINDPNVADPNLDLAAKQPGLDYLSVNGKIYGYPSEGDTAWLFYREDLLQAAGLDVPQTWDQYLEAATKLNNPPEIYGAVIGASRSEAGWDFMHYFYGFGGEVVDTQTWEAKFNNEVGVKALEFYGDLLNKYHVVSPDVTTFGYNEILAALQQGKAALGIEWMAATQDLTSCEVSPLVCDKLKYTLVPGHLDENGNLVRGQGASQWGFVIPKGSKHQEAAYKFIEWLTGKEGAKMWALNGGIPTNISALRDPEVVAKVPQFELLAEAMPYRHLFPNTTVTFDISEAFHEAAHNVVAGAKDAKTAADEAAAKMEEALRKGGYLK